MQSEARTEPLAWGVDPGYHDVRGEWHAAPPSTVAAVLRSLGADPTIADDGAVRAAVPSPPIGEHVWVVRHGDTVDAGGRFHLRTEDGQEMTHVGPLPPDLPLGYHDLQLAEAGRSIRLIVSPGICPGPPRAWGWAVQLYAALSESSWGIGDLNDLARLAEWSQSVGAGAVLINPLHAAAPAGPQEPSPYSPASRVFRSPLFLHVPAVDGADGLPGLPEAAAAAQASTRSGLIDRDVVWARKLEVLQEAFDRWEERGDHAGFAAYRAEQGDVLAAWGAWCVGIEMAGPDRSGWPPALTPVVLGQAVEAEAGLSRRARFHVWLQWQLDKQLETAATQGPALITDLAIGCDPQGFDTWLWADSFVSGVHVGAPPDIFAPEGQDWGLPPFDPWALRRRGFEPFIRVVRSGLRHAGGLRMDHVMGLFRLFAVPSDGHPRDGCYLRYPAHELLDILALEAHRAGAFVVGEDLGTVEPEVRAELARRRVLGTKLLWFEDDRPGSWAAAALAAVTTHDLPTVAGAWSGEDITDQQDAGAAVAEGAVEGLATRLADWAGLAEGAPVSEAITAAHRLLAEAPCAVVLATLEDATGQARRPNLPGTVASQRPNWSIPLPVTIEELPAQEGTRAIIDAMSERA